MYLISFADYLEFQRSQTKEVGNAVRLSEHVTANNVKRALLMRGLPFRVQHEQIVEFFLAANRCSSLHKNDIVIEEFNGKRTGAALVFFESE